MWPQPLAEIISRKTDISLRSVSGVDFGVNYVRLGQYHSQEVMHMRWETSETGLIAHEAVDVYQQQLPPLVLLIGLRRCERLL
jgi:hypothetical protein